MNQGSSRSWEQAATRMPRHLCQGCSITSLVWAAADVPAELPSAADSGPASACGAASLTVERPRAFIIPE